MFDHVSFPVADFERAKAFYIAALAPLGIRLLKEFPGDGPGGAASAGFGAASAEFWIGEGQVKATGVHVAFAAADRSTVDAFHAAALAAGGTDNGGPGLRPVYHADYYGAFVIDPDGNNIEAVCHRPASGESTP